MDKPYLTLVDPSNTTEHDQEFLPLPYYPWSERPSTVPLDSEEAATAIHLSHGDDTYAAELLKIPTIRLQRLIRQSPRLQRVQSESLNLALSKAASIPIRTLFDPQADARRLEWASTKVLQSRLAIGHPLSPAPAASVATTTNIDRRVVVLWGNGEKIAEIGPAGVDAVVNSSHASLHENEEP